MGGMGFAFEHLYEDEAYGCNCHYDDSDDSEEFFPKGERGYRRSCQPRNNYSHEDMEKNRQAERDLVSSILPVLMCQGDFLC